MMRSNNNTKQTTATRKGTGVDAMARSLLPFLFLFGSSVRILSTTNSTRNDHTIVAASRRKNSARETNLTPNLQPNNHHHHHHHHPCTQNPYHLALDQDIVTSSTNLDTWLSSTYHQYLDEAKVNHTQLSAHTRERYKFMDDSVVTCNKNNLDCVGGGGGGDDCAADEAKVTCGVGHLKPDCIIYSIGGNNMWNFEIDVLAKTPCEVHTFDCTGPSSRFDKIPQHERMHFHHVCLGKTHEAAKEVCLGYGKCGATWTLLEMQQQLRHTSVDLFKMDIEGFEWEIFDSWPDLLPVTQQQDPSPSSGSQQQQQQAFVSADHILLPHQMLVEFHYRSQFKELRPPDASLRTDIKSPLDFIKMAGHLARMGYAIVHKKDGIVKHCAELTIMRIQCPTTGVYASTTS